MRTVKDGVSWTGTGQVLINIAKELCLAIVEYFIDFGNKRFFILVPSPPIIVILFFKVSFKVS